MTNIRPATMKLARLTPLPETDPDRSDFECGCTWYYATAESDAAMWVCPDHRRPMAYDAMREALLNVREWLLDVDVVEDDGINHPLFVKANNAVNAALAAAEGKVTTEEQHGR